MHAKLFVFDRSKLFIGSMNFDQRSMHLNTEVGLLINSPVLARQVAERFDSMVQPANAYELTMLPKDAGDKPTLVWKTQENGKDVVYTTEPARSDWQKLQVKLLLLVPIVGEL